MRSNTPIILFSLVIFTAIVAALSSIPMLQAFANPEHFNVSLVISNSAPSISYVYVSSDTPSEGTTKVTQIDFNATDGNGIVDIPFGNAQVRINRSDATYTSSSCAVVNSAGNTHHFRCDITINYYDYAGGWTINASVFDGSSQLAVNTTEIFTMNSLSAIALKATTMTFSGSPGTTDNVPSNQPQIVNNTGNVAFTSFNLTAYNLQAGTANIGAGNFTVNTSMNAIGQELINNTNVIIANSAITRRNATNVSMYLDIPAGAANGTYTSTQSWVIRAE